MRRIERSASAWNGAIRTGSLRSHCAQTSSSSRPLTSNGSSARPGPQRVGRVAGGVAVGLEQLDPLVVRRIGLAGALEEHVPRAVELLAQHPRDLREPRQVAGLEQRVAGVRGERAEDVGAQHRHDHRAVAAAGLAGQAAVIAARGRRVALVDERHDLVAQVVLVAPGAGRVEELRAAEGGPGVDEDDDRVGAFAGGEQRVEALDHRRLERLAREPHVELAGVALDDVDARERLRVVALDARRAVDVERAPRRIAERVVREQRRIR